MKLMCIFIVLTIDEKDRNKVTAYIASNKSRQEFYPPLGQYADRVKAEPLHNTNNAWQQWFLSLLTVAMSMTNLKAANSVSSLPKLAVLSLFLTHLKYTVKCDRLHKNICNWFAEKRKKGLGFSYRFTGKNLAHPEADVKVYAHTCCDYSHINHELGVVTIFRFTELMLKLGLKLGLELRLGVVIGLGLRWGLRLGFGLGLQCRKSKNRNNP